MKLRSPKNESKLLVATTIFPISPNCLSIVVIYHLNAVAIHVLNLLAIMNFDLRSMKCHFVLG